MLRQIASLSFQRLLQRDPGICRDVKSWCLETYGPSSIPAILCPSRHVVRKLPRTNEQAVVAALSPEAEFDAYERFVAMIPGATLRGDEGFVVLPDGRFAFEHITHHEPFILNSDAYRKRFRMAAIRKRFWRGAYLSVLGTYCHTYYHWMHDVLTRFHRVLDWLPDDVRIVVPEASPSYQAESLRALGIPEARLVRFSAENDVTLEMLYFIPPPAVTRFDVPESIGWLREKLLAGFGLTTPETKRLLYISRAKASCRRIVNEEALLAVLLPLGFERVFCEKLTLRQQASLFQSARTIVAPHGAGLANLVFCAPDTEVLEIFPDSDLRERTHYWSMAQALGLNYACLCGSSVPNPGSDPDIRVDPEKVVASFGLWEEFE